MFKRKLTNAHRTQKHQRPLATFSWRGRRHTAAAEIFTSGHVLHSVVVEFRDKHGNRTQRWSKLFTDKEAAYEYVKAVKKRSRGSSEF